MNKALNITVTVLVVMLALFMTSCGALPPNRDKLISIKSDQTLPDPSPDTAVIVFLTGATNDAIYDVTSETPKLVGVAAAGTKITYKVAAGEHYFMLLTGQKFLIANVTGGKTYFVVAREALTSSLVGLATSLLVFASGDSPGLGELIPVRNGGEGEYQYSSEKIQSALEEAKLVDVTLAGLRYYGNETWVENVKNVQKKNLPKFKNKPEEALLKVTLNPEDGVLHEKYSTESNLVETSPSYSSELEALESLRDDGIFTEEEFLRQKAKLLDRE